MELLLIKAGEDYVRVVENGYTFCSMDKASVFPMEKCEAVKAHVRKLSAGDPREIRIKKLVIQEEDFRI